MIADLIVNGIAEIESLSTLQLAEINSYLQPLQTLRGSHVPAKADKDGDKYIRCYHLDTAVNCPHLIESALTWADLAYWYFGRQEPVLYSVNIFWTYPGVKFRKDLHDWHRDTDDVKQLAIFYALSDIPEDSAHCYLEESHRNTGAEAYKLPRREVFGPAGTAWIENPYGYHYGKQPSEPRCLAWARFGVSDKPKAYVADENYPVSSPLYDQLTERDKKICRLILC